MVWIASQASKLCYDSHVRGLPLCTQIGRGKTVTFSSFLLPNSLIFFSPSPIDNSHLPVTINPLKLITNKKIYRSF